MDAGPAGPVPTPLPCADSGLDGKPGSEECLSPDPHPSKPPARPHFPVGEGDLHVPMPILWPLNSTQSVYKTAEASGGFPETKRLLSHDIHKRCAIATSGQGPTTTGEPTDLPAI